MGTIELEEIAENGNNNGNEHILFMSFIDDKHLIVNTVFNNYSIKLDENVLFNLNKPQHCEIMEEANEEMAVDYMTREVTTQKNKFRQAKVLKMWKSKNSNDDDDLLHLLINKLQIVENRICKY